MKTLKISFLASLILLVSSFGNIYADSGQEITGIWLGTMKVTDALELRIGYVITEKEDGNLCATMNVIEQKAFDIPMDSVSLSDLQLQIDFTAAGIAYKGTFNPSDQLITGSYIQGEASYELILHKVDALPGEVVRTQTPLGPFPYGQEEVVFHNSEANVDLAGTLTIPESGTDFPAIILVHGSGHTDRNETKMGHFMLLADYFTRNGFIVLRYDKRGVGSSTGNYDEATTIDFAKDVEAGIEYLKGRVDVDNTRIGIIGHSEGTLIAPMVAADIKDLDFIVLLGCMGVDGGEIRLQQTELISSLNGVPESEIKAELASIKSYHEVIASDESSVSKFSKIKEMNPEISDGMINYMLKPWYKTFIELEPTHFLENVSCPVLALSGEKDVQCPPAGNLPLIESALHMSGNSNYKVEILPDLNHLLQTAKSGLPVEYDNIAEIIAQSALELMLGWIRDI